MQARQRAQRPHLRLLQVRRRRRRLGRRRRGHAHVDLRGGGVSRGPGMRGAMRQSGHEGGRRTPSPRCDPLKNHSRPPPAQPLTRYTASSWRPPSAENSPVSVQVGREPPSRPHTRPSMGLPSRLAMGQPSLLPHDVCGGACMRGVLSGGREEADGRHRLPPCCPPWQGPPAGGQGSAGGERTSQTSYIAPHVDSQTYGPPPPCRTWHSCTAMSGLSLHSASVARQV